MMLVILSGKKMHPQQVDVNKLINRIKNKHDLPLIVILSYMIFDGFVIKVEPSSNQPLVCRYVTNQANSAKTKWKNCCLNILNRLIYEVTEIALITGY